MRLCRRIRRDVKKRGRSIDSVIDQYLTTVKPMHELYVEPSKKNANLIVPEGGKNLIALEMIINRIQRHIDDRAGLGFTTVECGTDVLSALGRMDPGGAVLLDSVTALLSNEMFRADGTLDADAPEQLERELLAFSRQMRCCVFVSDYIYADGGQYDAWTEAYRRGLARLDRALAAACENAAELCCAQTYWYKGGFDR